MPKQQTNPTNAGIKPRRSTRIAKQPRTNQYRARGMRTLDRYLKRAGFTDLGRDEVRVTTKQDATFRGGRMVGDSNKLARARWRNSSSTASFSDWKRGREAQHLIPASLHKSFPSLKNMVDSPRNGMMLPSESTYDQPGNSPIFSDINKRSKPIHRHGNQYDHPTYSSNVDSFIRDVSKLPNHSTNKTSLGKVMDALRHAHKEIGREQTNTGQKRFVDDISVQRMKTSWNAVHGNTF